MGYRHADAFAEREQRLMISFDCGTDDRPLGHNRRFYEHLPTLNIEHYYAEFEGGHNWEHWDAHVQEALAQHARVLGLG